MQRIEYVRECPSDEQVYSMLRWYVAEWFRRRYGSFTLPQRCAIPLIKQGHNVLVSSPTGTGKTLAVFLGIIDELFRLAEEGRLEEKIYAVYVSPLRALNNDMRRNLLEPLRGIREVAAERGVELPEIRVAVRTSDTSPAEKQAMTRRPPHILITTPESLTIALVAPRFRERLATTRWVVIDEIHELASSKRGSLLSLTLERLEYLAGRLQRIGLSATIAPLEEVAKFLVGFEDDGSPRPCKIVDARFAKPIDIRVLCPVRDLINTPAEEVNEAIYRLLAKLIREHRTTLIFTNTRSATERVVYKLRRLLAEEGIADFDEIEAHHSSLSRDVRLEVEEKLKRGELKVVVSSTSLELGIDIGYIDLVVLLSSPKSVSRLLQRVGRAGHHIRQVSKGRIIVVDRDDLVECTVLAKAAMDRKIDRVHIPRNPLDILAQHLVGMSLEKRWKIDEAYRLIRRSYSFHTLDYRDYINTLRYLAGLYPDTLESLKVYAKIWLDEEKGEFGKKRSTRAIYAPNVGAIPDEAKIKVYTRDGRYVGDLEEAFVQILSPGDIFVLGGRTYRFIRSEGARVIVERVEGARPTVPVWFSEMLPLAFDSALLVGEFRRRVAEMIREGVPREKIVEWLVEEYRLEEHAAENIYEYIREQLEFTGLDVPSDRVILVELFIDEDEETSNVIFHTLFGRRVNDALSRAYAFRLAEKLGKPVRITVSDNGFMLTVEGVDVVDMATVKWLAGSVRSGELRDILRRVLRNTELLKRRFRHCAERALMILRRYRGYERSVHRMQINAQALLQAVEQLGDFPVLKEAYREILEDYMDVEHAEQVLRWVEEGRIRLEFFGPTRVPSPFAHHLVARGYSDVVLMEDRRRVIAELHRRVMELLAARRAAAGGGAAAQAMGGGGGGEAQGLQPG